MIVDHLQLKRRNLVVRFLALPTCTVGYSVNRAMDITYTPHVRIVDVRCFFKENASSMPTQDFVHASLLPTGRKLEDE